jgi:hypothetical protein
MGCCVRGEIAVSTDVRNNAEAEKSAASNNDAEAEKFAASKNLFIIFVHAIFTTLFMCLFTNVFDVAARTPANSCVYRMCNAD